MANPWAAFRSLFADPPRWIGEVTAHNADGTSTVVLVVSGETVRAEGQGVAVGLRCYVRAGVVEGPAPDLPVVLIDV